MLAPMIYDTVEIQFSWERFFRQFAIHIFSPMFLWLSPNLEIQGFKGVSFAGLYFNWVIHFMVILMMYCAYISPSNVYGNSSALYTPLAFYLIQRLMIALKYATLSESEYERLMTCKEPAVYTEYIKQLQIILGIIGGNFQLIEFEIASAATRLAIKDLSLMRFKVHLSNATFVQNYKSKFTEDHIDWEPSVMSDWRSFLSKGFTQNSKSYKISPVEKEYEKVMTDVESGDDVLEFHEKERKHQPVVSPTDPKFGYVPVSVVSTAMILRASKMVYPKIKHVYYLGLMGAALIVIQPFLVAFQNPSVGEGNMHISHEMRIFDRNVCIVFYICSTMLNVTFIPVIITFLYGVVLASMRMCYCATVLTVMLAPYPMTRVTNYLFHNLQCIESDIGKSKGLIGEVQDSNPDMCHFVPVKNGTKCKLELQDVPTLGFDEPSNVFAYLYTRLIMQNFGLRFGFRFDVYVGALVQIVAMLMIYIIILFYTSDDPSAVSKKVLFRQGIIIVLILTMFILTIVLIGAGTNLEYVEHRKSLMRHTTFTQNALTLVNMKIREAKDNLEGNGGNGTGGAKRRRQRSQMDVTAMTGDTTASTAFGDEDMLEKLGAQEERLRNTLDALSVAKDSIDLSTELYPVKFLRFESSYALAYSICTTMISFFIYIASEVNSSPSSSSSSSS